MRCTAPSSTGSTTATTSSSWGCYYGMQDGIVRDCIGYNLPLFHISKYSLGL